jgi:hypothetical protein
MESHRKRLLATTVDDRAESNPNQRFAVIPQGSEISNGFQELSIKDLARAVNFMCWWIEGTIGPAQSPETLAYMGSNDVRYFMFMLACQKTGYQVRKYAIQSEARTVNLILVGPLTFHQELGRSPCSYPESDKLHQVLLQRGAPDTKSGDPETCSGIGYLRSPNYYEDSR